LAISAVSAVFALSPEELVPGYAVQLTADDKIVFEAQLKNPAPKLLPLDNDLKQFLSVEMETLNPGIMVEALYLFNKPADSLTEKEEIFNKLTAISTLAGIQYYSASRGVMRTLFEYSAVIDGPDTKRPLADPFYRILPAKLTVYTRQKDLTFGDNIYLYNFFNADNGIFFMQENITTMNYSFVPVIRKGNLKIIMAVFDCGGSLLIYTVSMAKAVTLPGMGEWIGNSFSNRAEAILKWFTDRADQVIN